MYGIDNATLATIGLVTLMQMGIVFAGEYERDGRPLRWAALVAVTGIFGVGYWFYRRGGAPKEEVSTVAE